MLYKAYQIDEGNDAERKSKRAGIFLRAEVKVVTRGSNSAGSRPSQDQSERCNDEDSKYGDDRKTSYAGEAPVLSVELGEL